MSLDFIEAMKLIKTGVATIKTVKIRDKHLHYGAA